ncbi:MAG: NAD(P)-dependent oxidoreductase, partial [Proteobacteria bacterium]|nr:NAD(P)-dependent oxidoreductase [Pseudomonadota bacterium]
MQRVLITGAAGNIGGVLRAGLGGVYPALRLSDIKPLGAAREGEELVQADLRDLAEVEAVMAGVDAVVHLGGVPVEDAWAPIHEVNIIGCYHVFEAARRQGVKRVVFASSNHVIGYHRRSERIDDTAMFRPDSRYGLSKLFGEGLGRLYADKHGIACVALRIGSFQPKPKDLRMLSTWISHRDMVRLVRRALEAEGVHFEIVYGVSANDRNWWDNPGAARIGYAPQDNAEDHAE